MWPGVGRLLIRLGCGANTYPANLSTDANSPGLRRSALDAERPLGPLDGLRLGR